MVECLTTMKSFDWLTIRWLQVRALRRSIFFFPFLPSNHPPIVPPNSPINLRQVFLQVPYLSRCVFTIFLLGERMPPELLTTNRGAAYLTHPYPRWVGCGWPHRNDNITVMIICGLIKRWVKCLSVRVGGRETSRQPT